jgi:hypothetical protein
MGLEEIHFDSYCTRFGLSLRKKGIFEKIKINFFHSLSPFCVVNVEAT